MSEPVVDESMLVRVAVAVIMDVHMGDPMCLALLIMVKDLSLSQANGKRDDRWLQSKSEGKIAEYADALNGQVQ